ncbi:hypothetical protein YPPY66_3181, partial [Yersinia pestis PY-66]
MARLAKP